MSLLHGPASGYIGGMDIGTIILVLIVVLLFLAVIRRV